MSQSLRRTTLTLAPMYRYAEGGGLIETIPPHVLYGRPERVLFVYRRGKVLALFPDIVFTPEGEKRQHVKCFILRGSRYRWCHVLPSFLDLPRAGRPDYAPVRRKIEAVAYPDLIVVNEAKP